MKKKAYYRKIPVYFNDETAELIGRNWFYQILLNINLWFDITIIQIDEFPILIEDDEEKS